MLREKAENIEKCLRLIKEHAVKVAPSECCGIVLGKEPFKASSPPDFSNDLEVFLCTNIQDRMHANDPEQYKRGSHTAYFIDPVEQAEVLMATRTEGLLIVAFYHSHIDCGVYFSDEDKRLATWDDAPAFPGAAYIIVSVADGKAKDSGIFLWDEAGKNFIKSPIRIK